jgi:hypothetical protein
VPPLPEEIEIRHLQRFPGIFVRQFGIGNGDCALKIFHHCPVTWTGFICEFLINEAVDPTHEKTDHGRDAMQIPAMTRG